jgi:hypothetical protein
LPSSTAIFGWKGTAIALLYTAMALLYTRQPTESAWPFCKRLCSPAALQASLKALPNDSLVNGLPFLPQMKASSPIGPASRYVAGSAGLES